MAASFKDLTRKDLKLRIELLQLASNSLKGSRFFGSQD